MKLSLKGGLQKIYGLEGGLGLKGGYETLRGVTNLYDTVQVARNTHVYKLLMV